MPTIRVNGAEIFYAEHGAGPETIVFAHGLLWSSRMFDDQVVAFKDRYRCITFDFRGQGRSAVTRGGYDLDTLAEDAAALIEVLGAAPCHFLGLSMGGMIAMRLGIRRPELIRSLILLETSADPEPAENVPKYRMFALAARWLGPQVVGGRIMPIMFGQKFLTDPARAAQREEWRRRAIANHPIGIYRATLGVISRRSLYDELHTISAPTLVVVGDQDVATVPEKARRIHERIRGSMLVIIPGAGHTSAVEEPQAVNMTIEAFLSAL